jgi:hypothetical protein
LLPPSAKERPVPAAIFPPDPFSLLLLGIACCLVSAVVVFGRRLRFRAFAVLVGIASFLPLPVLEYLLDIPIRFSMVLPILACLSLVVILGRSSVWASFIANSARRFRRPAYLGSLLILVGIGLLGFASAQSDPVDDDMAELLKEMEDEKPRDFQPIEGLNAATDRGTPITLLQITNTKAEALAKVDRRIADARIHGPGLIRVAESSAQTNCHGWVFTGGMCWITHDSVEVILLENDYQQVEWPAANDVVIYRDEQGKIAHTGIVRAVLSEGRILVESKWGAIGAFLHYVEHSIYGINWTFHHSTRPTHVLRGLPQPSTESAHP